MQIESCLFKPGSQHRPGYDVLSKKTIILHTFTSHAADSAEAVKGYFHHRKEQGIPHYVITSKGEIQEYIPAGEVAHHLGGVVKYSELIDFFGFGEDYKEQIFDNRMCIEQQRYNTRKDNNAPAVIKSEWNMNYHSAGVMVCTNYTRYHNTNFTPEALDALSYLLNILKNDGWDHIALRKQLHNWNFNSVHNLYIPEEEITMPAFPDHLKVIADELGINYFGKTTTKVLITGGAGKK
jgi:hypothetical protein